MEFEEEKIESKAENNKFEWNSCKISKNGCGKTITGHFPIRKLIGMNLQGKINLKSRKSIKKNFCSSTNWRFDQLIVRMITNFPNKSNCYLWIQWRNSNTIGTLIVLEFRHRPPPFEHEPYSYFFFQKTFIICFANFTYNIDFIRLTHDFSC